MNFIDTRSYGSAEQFLLAFMPVYFPFNEQRKRNEYLFRGQSNDRWQLLPRALREDTEFYVDDLWTKGNYHTHKEQILAELSTVLAFFESVDQLGLALPEDGQQLRLLLTKRYPSIISAGAPLEEWPPRKALSLFALAQHFGIPTRLLDWTYNPMVAMYMAAKDCVNNFSQSDPDSAVVVWWFSTKGLHEFELTLQGVTYPKVEIINAPEYGNPNLHSQSGAFLLHNWPLSMNASPDKTPFEVLLAEYEYNTQLHKYILPAYQAPKLLQLLSQLKINAGTLESGYQGAVNAIKEEKLWRL